MKDRAEEEKSFFSMLLLLLLLVLLLQQRVLFGCYIFKNVATHYIGTCVRLLCATVTANVCDRYIRFDDKHK